MPPPTPSPTGGTLRVFAPGSVGLIWRFSFTRESRMLAVLSRAGAAEPGIGLKVPTAHKTINVIPFRKWRFQLVEVELVFEKATKKEQRDAFIAPTLTWTDTARFDNRRSGEGRASWHGELTEASEKAIQLSGTRRVDFRRLDHSVIRREKNPFLRLWTIIVSFSVRTALIMLESCNSQAPKL